MSKRLLLSSSQPDTKLLESLAVAQAACLIIVTLIAGPVLVAWLVPGVASLMPDGWALMKANSALGMLMGVASLALSRSKQGDRQLARSRILGVLLAIGAGLVLLQYLTGVVVGIDTLLAADETSPKPGRISPQTATYLFLLGSTLVDVRARKNASSHVVDTLTMGLVILTLVVLAGYCFGATHLFGLSAQTRTSPQTLSCMLLLTFVKISRRAEYGYFSVLIGIGIGSRFARIVLPFAFVLPFLAVFAGAYTTLAGWLSTHYAAALTAAVIAFALFSLVIFMAWRINDLERELRSMSLTDELTGVLNRRGFDLLGDQAVRGAQRTSSPLAVLFFDLDGLKKANDTFGHDVGSQFVVDVAELLRSTFRGTDIIGRVGGDEFVVVTNGDTVSVGNALARLNEAAVVLNKTRIPLYEISYSVGEANLDLSARESFTELVARADTRMYEQKIAKKKARQAV